jgi:glycosyltransferase involved in cell wall biosynthesis
MSKTLLQINTEINAGSHGKIAEAVGQLAMERGWESYIAYGKNPRPSQSHAYRIESTIGRKWHGIQTRLFDRCGLSSVRATKRLVEKIKEIQPDIIHLHNLHGYYLNIEILFNYLATTSIPLVWTLHDCWPITGHCAHFSFIGCEKWKTQCEHCPYKRGYPASYGLDRSYKNYRLKKGLFNSVQNMTLVPFSDWLAVIISQSFLKEYPIKTIHNGIDTSVFAPRLTHELRLKHQLTGRFILLGVAIVWDKRKGLSDFYQLSQQLKPDEQLILIGLTDRQIRQLPPNIRGIRHTENAEQLAEWYSMADVYLNPTWEDNFPTTNLEALACGTPVITYRTGGSPEAITSETGFVVEQGDLKGVRNAIDTIKSKGKAFYARACRERAIRMFNKNDRYAEYLQLYDQMLSEKVTSNK